MKLLLLSDKSGSGTSVFLRQTAMKLKRRFPLKWVSFVDLKGLSKAFSDAFEKALETETFSNKSSKNLMDFISTTILNLTSTAEREIFTRKFTSNDCIFIWDGIDRLNEAFRSNIFNLIKFTAEVTENHHWMSTNSQFLNISTSYRLQEFNEADVKEFVRKFFEVEKVQKVNVSKALEEVKSVDQRLTGPFSVTVRPSAYPGLLKMILKENLRSLKENRTANLYSMFENHVSEKFEDLEVQDSQQFRRIHQRLAILIDGRFLKIENVYNDEFVKVNSLEIVKDKVLKEMKEEDYFR